MANNLLNFVEPFSVEMQEIEDMLDEFKLKRSISFAEGAQLNIIGEIVGESRNGKSDSAYLEAIRLKIRLNLTAGKVNTVIEYVIDKTNSTTVRLVEHFPAGIVLYVDGDQTINNFTAAVQGVKALLAAGVALRSLRYVNPSYEPFALDESGFSPSPYGAGFLEKGYSETEHSYTAGALVEAAN